jgi:hypothetical protein
MKNNPTGFTNQIDHITQASLAGGSKHTMSAEAGEAHIEFMPTGGLTIQLPGPNAVPPTQPAGTGDIPNDGDTYVWRDPLGLITGGNFLTVDGGGFNFGSFGEPSTLPYDGGSVFGSAGYTFNGNLKLWVPWCPCATPAED